MIEKETFLEKYNIDAKEFEAMGINWVDLMAIYEDYTQFRSKLEDPATYFLKCLIKSPKVHSVRYRIKDAEHLIEKIIRKRMSESTLQITVGNYREVVNDLIGLRILHLFKADWEPINRFIRETWDLKQKPVVNYRLGDSEQTLKVFDNDDFQTNKHPQGYRSIHYIIEATPEKTKFYAEIQVRTIFEEAWSEIDHHVRYPYNMHDPTLAPVSSIINGIAGNADEMGALILALQNNTSKDDFQVKIDNEVNFKQVTSVSSEEHLEEVIDEDLSTSPMSNIDADLDKQNRNSAAHSLSNITLPDWMAATLNPFHNFYSINNMIMPLGIGQSRYNTFANTLHNFNSLNSIIG